MIAEQFSKTWFKLEPDTDSETLKESGVAIQGPNDEDLYINETYFRFTDKTASNDATLKELGLSRGEKSDDPDLNTYKEYEITPEGETAPGFDPIKLNYTREILEYIDDIDLNFMTNDKKASVKIKIPKRDETTGELVSKEDGTLEYEEKEIMQDETGAKLNIKLNELGKEDTKITISVTAESKKVTNDYVVTIKRPFATIKGSIYTAPTASLSKHIANIRIYKTEEVQAAIDLEDKSLLKTIHTTLLSLESKDFTTKEDGTYEIYVIPGKYHMLLDKDGYLDNILILPELKDKDEQDIGQKNLTPGDVNKDGLVDQKDVGILMTAFGKTEGNALYEKNINCDFDESKLVDQKDIGYMYGSFSKLMKIETL